MKIQSQNNINFQKNLRANCCIINNGKPEQCRIYQLDAHDKDDLRYFDRLAKNKDWTYSQLVECVDFYDEHPQGDCFVLETSRGKCLGFCEVDRKDKKEDELFLIETMPTAAREYPDRKRRYIGETLISFLLKNARRNNKEAVRITGAVADAWDFYGKKCGFDRCAVHEFVKRTSDADKLFEINKGHTGTEIEFIG